MSFSIFDAARARPNALALRVDGSDFTFEELAERARARTDELVRGGMHAADARPVALVASPELATLEWLYALMAGGVPVLPIHPRLTASERETLLASACAQCLVDGSRILSLPRAEEPAFGDERPLAVVPTSGSTGKPKLVLLPPRAFLASARSSAKNLGLTAADRWLLCLPLAHVGGLSIVTRSLLARSAVVLFRSDHAGLLASAAALARAIETERATLVSLVPTLLERLLALEPPWLVPASLRCVLLGGSGTSAALLDRSQRRRVPVRTTYGLTEACSQVTTSREPDAARGIPTENGMASSGHALDGIELRIVDDIIQLRGDTLCSGYAGEPSPLQPDGWFRTGDRGRFDAENGLFVFGRVSDVIITGGENVDPLEVEAVLAGIPGVRAACVFGVEDRAFGQIVAAAFERSSEEAIDLENLSRSLAARLAPFKRPRLIAELESLPQTASGKVDRPGVQGAVAGRLRPLLAARGERP